MNQISYKCRICGKIIKGLDARRDHCQLHHPSVASNRLDIFFRGDFQILKGEEAENMTAKDNDKDNMVVIKKKDKNGNVTYTTKKKDEEFKDFDYSRATPVNVPFRPKSSNAEDLFEFAVKYYAYHSTDVKSLFERNIFLQWRNICFGFKEYTTEKRQAYMSLIKDEYSVYFKRVGNKYYFDYGLITRDFPHFFKGGEKHLPKKQISLDSLISALKKEIDLSTQPQNRLKYKVKKIVRIDMSKQLYQFHLDLKDDDMPSFYEGINLKLLVKDRFYDCEGIDYDLNEDILTVRSSSTIIGVEGKIYLDTSFILEALVGRLADIMMKGFGEEIPANKFIPDTTGKLSAIPNVLNSIDAIENRMDKHQRKAYNFALGHNVSFIWGPPGTGKSFTLASLISTFFHNDSSTLICCISNVAVDQLLNKVIDVLEDLNLHPRPGQLLRSGHTIDSRLISKDYLFPSDSETRRIRENIKNISQKIASPGCDLKAKTFYKEKLLDLREALKKRTESLIGGSTIVFTTIANYALSKSLEEKQFDNLIVDEASMLSLPYLMAIAGKISKRIIIVGDPNQLGPISINPDPLLRQSIFDYCKVFSHGENKHRALCQLLTQRRSHSCIVNLTNAEFYEGKLSSVINNSPDWVKSGPFPKKIIKVVNDDIEDNETKMVGTSRRNMGTCEKVMELLQKFYQYFSIGKEKISIGIITPYRSQVRMYHAKCRELYKNTSFLDCIKIGTIHTFQGSECDLVFLDLVEKSPTPVSKLLNRKEGERLITVALTRARHKMIIVGDTKRFAYGAGIANVSDKVCRVLKNLRDR